MFNGIENRENSRAQMDKEVRQRANDIRMKKEFCVLGSTVYDLSPP
jgi:hypothetical protein